MVEGALWFGAALLPQGLDSLLSSTGKINSQVYQDIFQDNVRLSVRQLKLSRSWVVQQETNTKIYTEQKYKSHVQKCQM
jgi:hypothetical protein